MWETVRIANGYEIVRMKGTHGFYHINVKEDNGKGFREYHVFKTIKSAVAFANSLEAR